MVSFFVTQVEELRASERNLRVRVKSLTNELAVYKRYDLQIITAMSGNESDVKSPLPKSYDQQHYSKMYY